MYVCVRACISIDQSPADDHLLIDHHHHSIPENDERAWPIDILHDQTREKAPQRTEFANITQHTEPTLQETHHNHKMYKSSNNPYHSQKRDPPVRPERVHRDGLLSRSTPRFLVRWILRGAEHAF